MASLWFSPLPISHNSPRALLAISRQSISLERKICSKQEALASSCSSQENSRVLPKTSDLCSRVAVALGALSPLSFVPPCPASPVITQGRKRWTPSRALITGLPDCNYRLSLPSYPNDSHNRDWNSSVRWNQLLSKIGRLIFLRMRYAF